MSREEIRTANEDSVKAMVDRYPRLHQAIAYKYLHAMGWRVSDVDAAIREEIEKLVKAEREIQF